MFSATMPVGALPDSVRYEVRWRRGGDRDGVGDGWKAVCRALANRRFLVLNFMFGLFYAAVLAFFFAECVDLFLLFF